MSFANTLKENLSVAGFKLRKAGPSIGVAAGVAGIGVTAVLASRATLKAQDIKTTHEEEIKTIDEAWELHKQGANAAKDYDEKAYAYDHAQVWVNSGIQALKLYLPAITVGIASATLIICSHKTMSNRLGAMSAAYSVLQSTFDTYRQRVEEHFGKEEVNAVVSDREKEAEDLKAHYDDHKVNLASYGRLFGEGRGTLSYQRDPMANIQFLSSKQNYFNDLLQQRGYVFLNEVYEGLGYEATPSGQMVGWLRSDRHDAKNDVTGDGFIDFGIFNSTDPAKRINDHADLQWGDEILLEFNVDHKPIFNLI